MTTRPVWLTTTALGLLIATHGTPLVGQGAGAPEPWVPFVADYEQSGSSGTVRGRLWRGADGSVRLETGDGLVAPHIQIRNISRDTYYEFRALSGWTSLPLRAGGAPATRAEDAGSEATPVLFEGRAALRRSSPAGQVDVIVPELNFLPVERSLPDGSRVALRNIRTDVALNAALFEPPAGASVRWLGPPVPQRRENRGDELRELPEPR